MSQDNRQDFQLPAWADALEPLSRDKANLKGQVTLHFPDGSEPLSVSRRDFLRVAGAAAAATGLSACRVPQDHIAPYAERPEEVYHGVPNTFGSVCRGCASQCGTLMTVREGRVSKLEGNPDHPASRGGLCARGQASVMDVYSPDRLQKPFKAARGQGGAESTWEELDKAAVAALTAAKGGKVRLLTGAMTGPAQLALVKAFTGAFGDGSHVIWEPLAATGTAAAHAQAYGEAFVPFYRFDKAAAVVSFGAEFLDAGDHSVIYTRQFAATRDPDLGEKMSHLTAFEGRLTLTGAAADARHRVRTSDLLYAALGVAHELIIAGGVGGELASDPNVKATLGGYAADKVASSIGVEAGAIKAAAARLKAAGKAGLAVSARPGSSAEATGLEAVTALINEALGAVGSTVEHTRVAPATTDFTAFDGLVKELAAGAIDVLIISGTNPVHTAPAGLNFADAMGKAKTVIAVDTQLTETAVAADWAGAASHFLEAWGDAATVTGVYSIQQPGMQPIHDTRTFEDCLVTWGAALGAAGMDAATKASAAFTPTVKGQRSPGPWYYFLSAHWSGELYAATGSKLRASAFWEGAVRKGTYTAPRSARQVQRFNTNALKSIAGARTDKAAGAMEVELYATTALYDGRQASNPVLIELPDTITKACWGNYACVSPARFKALGLKRLGDMVKVAAEGGASVDLPAMMVPGMHDDVVAIPLGFGRKNAGVVGSEVGANAYPLAGHGADGLHTSGLKVTVSATGGFEELGMARGAEHVLDNHTRHIVPAATMAEYMKDKKAGAHEENLPAMWEVHKYPELKWGMAIDLSRCTGCSACVAACNVENNIPAVGKQGVLEGRLMHWLRIDRYFALPHGAKEGGYDEEMLTDTPLVAAADYLASPQMLLEPMMCQHCDIAPCETVCPVAATVHSDDGLNEQVYNRCVGTRYCANNCPYKVRRFNWYNYSKDRSDEFISDVFPEIQELADLNARWPQALRFNPEVTVRSRGVMEKCSFCVQRLRRNTVVHKKLGIANVQEPKTACQQTCPAEAISFGNVSDEKSSVYKAYNSERAFAVISQVGTKPAVRYLTRVRHGEAQGANE